MSELTCIGTRKDPMGEATRNALLYIELAYIMSRGHRDLAALAEEQFGPGDGRFISGIVRSHFPDHIKDRLRGYAEMVGTYLDASLRSWRAAGRTRATWIREKDRIKARDGSGFYG